MIVENQATHAMDRQILRDGAYLEDTLSQTPLHFGDVLDVQETLKNEGWTTNHRVIESSNVPNRYSAGKCQTHSVYLIYNFRTCLSMVTELDGSVARYNYTCSPTRSWTSPARLFFTKQEALSTGFAGISAFGCGQVASDGKWFVQVNGSPVKYKEGILRNVNATGN